jgi:triphosphoribosyl-dephospho-CoA synthase
MATVQALRAERGLSRWPYALANLAREALIAEAELTPKPGLVDRRGSGAHDDLSLVLMKRSAAVLEPFFVAMGAAAEGRVANIQLREELAAIGREAERAMLSTTGGANSHKGAIWLLGLLVAAAAQEQDRNAQQIAEAAGAIARLPDRVSLKLVTHGELVKRRYGMDGARGEAQRAFPHVVRLGLPTLCKGREEGRAEDICRLDVLFRIMSELDDTCVLYRGGLEALRATKQGARAVLSAGGNGSALGRFEARKLDRELSARRISPGGSADLLAATILLDAVDQQQEVRRDQSKLGGHRWRRMNSNIRRRVAR